MRQRLTLPHLLTDWVSWIRPFSVQYRPLHGVEEVVRDGVSWWRCSGGDPSFHLDWNPGPGWYRIIVWFEFTGIRIESALCFDLGGGFTHVGAARWQAPPNQPATRLVLFTGAPRGVRLDLQLQAMEFRIARLTVRRVSAHFARGRVLAKIDAGVTRGIIHPEEVSALSQKYGGGDTHDWYPLYDHCCERLFQRGTYARWLAHHEVGEHKRLRRIRAALPVGTGGVTFDLLVVVRQPASARLHALSSSLLAQSHAGWRLLLVDGTGAVAADPALVALVGSDPRIVLLQAPDNTALLATALAHASAPWVGVVEADGRLHPDALAWMAEAVATHPDAAAIYSDEDRMTDAGERRDPRFKPAFNYDLLLGED